MQPYILKNLSQNTMHQHEHNQLLCCFSKEYTFIMRMYADNPDLIYKLVQFLDLIMLVSFSPNCPTSIRVTLYVSVIVDITAAGNDVICQCYPVCMTTYMHIMK